MLDLETLVCCIREPSVGTVHRHPFLARTEHVLAVGTATAPTLLLPPLLSSLLVLLAVRRLASCNALRLAFHCHRVVRPASATLADEGSRKRARAIGAARLCTRATPCLCVVRDLVLAPAAQAEGPLQGNQGTVSEQAASRAGSDCGQ